MNQDERQKLDEIHADVRQTRTRVEIIDERTENLDERVSDNTEEIDTLQSQVDRNTTILGGFGTGAAAVLLWVSDKLTRLI